MKSGAKVAVLGANGHTARFVVDTLRSKGAVALPGTRSGRFVDHGGIAELCSVVDFSKPDNLDRILAGADAVINCAGPFFDTAEPAAEAAVRARIPYLDIAAEQMTVLGLFESMDERAKNVDIPILPAMAFYGGLADLLASALAIDLYPINSIEIAVGLNSWRPTNGTRLTGEQNRFERLIVRDSELTPVPVPPPSRVWDFAMPMGSQPVTCVPLSEIILISRHLKAREITSFMNLKPLEDLRDGKLKSASDLDSSGRSAQKFTVEVRVESKGRVLCATAQGQDIYAVTAPLIVNACLELLERGWTTSGVRAASELFEPRRFLQTLEPDIHVKYEADVMMPV